MAPKRAASDSAPIEIDSASEDEPTTRPVDAEPKASGKKSWVWQYFKTTTTNDASFNVCQVNKTPGGRDLCLKKLAVNGKGSTKSMINHLDRCHKIHEGKSDTGAITKFLKKGKLPTKLNRDSLTATVARFFINCNIPYIVIEDEEFRELLRLCNPETKNLICTADTLALFIQLTFQQGQQVLCEQLRGIKSQISLTCDTWTSPSNQSILGVTAHWIDKNFSLWSIVLAARIVDGTHAGVNLGKHLIEVLKSFDITNKVFCITADNATNNSTMSSYISTQIQFNSQNCMLGCMAHVINLAAQAGIKSLSQPPPPPPEVPQGLSSILNDEPVADPIEFKSVVSRISSLTTFLKRSPQKKAAFLDITICLMGKKLLMIDDVATRWNSTFHMLRRAYSLRACIAEFCEAHNLSEKYDLTPGEWDKVKLLCNFLEPLEEATDTISPEKTPTLVLAAPVYICLMEKLTEASKKYGAQGLIPAAQDMLDKLKGYFNSAINKPVYLCSTLLDPRIKMDILSPEVLAMMTRSRKSIIDDFRSEAEKYMNNRYNKDHITDEPSETAPKNTLKSSLFKKKKRKMSSLDEEVDYYLSSECKEESCDPLVFWKTHSEQFPTLATMARTYLLVPASSAPTERAFSAGRYIQDYTRNRMKVETLESLICLKDWLAEAIIDVDTIKLPTL